MSEWLASLGRVRRAFPTLLRVGFAEAVAYRAELLVWVLATTMPFISLALWWAVAQEGVVASPRGRVLGEKELLAYFLAVFIVRQICAAWAAWEINYEVRTGALSMRLLRPIHPLFCYAAENLAAVPMRLIVAVPVGIVAFWFAGDRFLPQQWEMWVLLPISLLGAWLCTFFTHAAIGCLSLYTKSSLKVLDVWWALFFVFSGYLYPVEMFPPALRAIADVLPFRYQMGLPVEILTSAMAPDLAFRMVGIQWSFVVVLMALALSMWKSGVRRFAAYGG